MASLIGSSVRCEEREQLTCHVDCRVRVPRTSADVGAADTCTYRLQSHQLSLATAPLDHTGSILPVGEVKTG